MEMNFKKSHEILKKKIEETKVDSKSLKKIKAEKKAKEPEVQAKVMLARKVFDESMDMFKEGEMTWEEAVDDISKVLKAI
ncbi:hypothetical protein [Persephonella sp.]